MVIDKRSSSSEQNHLSRKRQEVENGSELEKSTPEERSGFDGCGIQVKCSHQSQPDTVEL
ncbi:hypothetical protein HanXRQr2_Chr05g0193051 [Helianthus annuus]|uniref:Uncharacterized protein n=1 Tax=Helianthus annuus TaxID=4232 RepID=A0A9K3NKZ2_HELAN|nr:hypothetical protein HanXRQr2_Chr05g0193051 [Helianthus annuus]